jgi:hypothetical protein
MIQGLSWQFRASSLAHAEAIARAIAVRGIFSVRAPDARFLRGLHTFLRASMDLAQAHSKIMPSEIACRAAFCDALQSECRAQICRHAPPPMPSMTSPPQSGLRARRLCASSYRRSVLTRTIRWPDALCDPRDSSALRSYGRAARCRAVSYARIRAPVGAGRGARSFLGRRPHITPHHDL